MTNFAAQTASKWIQLPAWLRLSLAAALATCCVLVLSASPSFADDGATNDPAAITDSSGVPVGAYKSLPIDRGSLVYNQDKGFWSKPVDFIWTMTFNNTTLTVLLNKFLMSFGWVDWIKGPAVVLAGGFEQLIAGIQWLPFVAMMAGLLIGWMWMRGRTGAGWAELAMSAIVIALVTTVLANPVSSIAGPNGALVKAQEYGKKVGAELLTSTKNPDGTQPDEVINKEASQPIVDAFVRYPYQVAAFGKVIDNNPACKTAFDNVMKNIKLSSDADGEKIRKAVEGCDKQASETALNPDATMVWNLWVGSSATGLLQLFLNVLGALMIIAVGFLLYESIKMVWSAKAAVIPGMSRASLSRSVAMCAFYLFAVAGSFIFLTLYMIFIKMVFAQNWTQNPLILWNVVNALLILGTVILIRMWIRGKKAGESIADKLRKIGFGNPEYNVRTVSAKDVRNGIDRASTYAWRRRMTKNQNQNSKQESQEEPAPQDETPATRPTKISTPTAAQQPALGPGGTRKQLPPPPTGSKVPALPPGPSMPPATASTASPGAAPGKISGTAGAVQGIVLSAREAATAKDPTDRRRAAAGAMIRAAAQLHPYSRAAVMAVDGVKAVRNRAELTRPPTAAQLALQEKLRAHKALTASPVKR